MSLFKKIFQFAGFIAIMWSVSYCAKMGTISGGPKDEDPPVLIGSEPDQFATNFKGKKVRLDFNEFVQLKEFNSQFNVSPPLKKKPKVWINNKSVYLQYADTLMDSTTYTMNFGSSLADNNEGNVLDNFEFVFSTTNYIDSMGVQGLIVDAFTGKPGKDPFLVGLYLNMSDTAPYTQRPMFTGRSNKEGIFRINNVKNGIYRLYAFQDKNNNLKYDAVSEAFAFADTIVVLTPEFLTNFVAPQNVLDSLMLSKKHKRDTLINADSLLLHDSIHVEETKQFKNKLSVELFSFIEKSKKQYIKDYSWKNERFFTVSFNLPLIYEESVITPIYMDIKDWCQIEMGPNNDSLIYWVTDTSLLRIDSVRCSISFLEISENNDTIWGGDTVKFAFIPKETGRKQKSSDTIVEKMPIKVDAGTLDLNKDLVIETGFPIDSYDISKISLIERVDTLDVPREFSLTRDTIFPRKFKISYKWPEQTSFKLLIYPKAFTNIYDLEHDTVKVNFSTQKLEYYGMYTINISENEGKTLIVQLIDKEKVLYEKYISGNGSLDFDFLSPGSYTLKAIWDRNGDKKYTIGDFLEKRQAENVTIHKTPLLVRSNWESTLEWAPIFNE